MLHQTVPTQRLHVRTIAPFIVSVLWLGNPTAYMYFPLPVR